MERRVFQTNCKNSANKPATAGEMLADDANNQYFVGCNSSRELCLDILTKIKNSKVVFPDRKKYRIDYSDELMDLVLKLLDKDKSTRLGA